MILKWKRIALLLLLIMVLSLVPKIILASPIRVAAPKISIANVNSTQVTLKWSSIFGFYKYNIYRADTDDSDYTLIASTFVSTFTDVGLKSSTEYRYLVRAYKSNGTYVDSDYIKIVTSAPKQVLGFTVKYSEGDKSSYNSLAANHTILDSIATYTYTTDGSGNISGSVPYDHLSLAGSSGVMSLALLTNNFDGKTAKDLLENTSNRQNLINNILSALESNNYSGVNIDLEGVYYYNREYFTAFMKELYGVLNPRGFLVTVDVPAKTLDNPTNGWNGAFDYSEIAKYSDKVIIMAYDEHYPGGPAGPIASIEWVKEVVNYSLTVIPKEKLVLGVAAYGYDWSSNGTKSYGIDKINDIAVSYGASIQWDSVSQSPYFNYTDSSKIKHTVWFENSTSLSHKLDIANQYGLSGIAIWRLGLENQDYWEVIKLKLNK